MGNPHPSDASDCSIMLSLACSRKQSQQLQWLLVSNSKEMWDSKCIFSPTDVSAFKIGYIFQQHFSGWMPMHFKHIFLLVFQESRNGSLPCHSGPPWLRKLGADNMISALHTALRRPYCMLRADIRPTKRIRSRFNRGVAGGWHRALLTLSWRKALLTRGLRWPKLAAM